jgi:hypothetical protein
MNFEELHATIPYVKGGKEKVLSMEPYPYVKIMMPGRHAKDTDPVGGDFVVCVTEPGMSWQSHQFTHSDIFGDLAKKAEREPDFTDCLMGAYLEVIRGEDPTPFAIPGANRITFSGIHYKTFLYAAQCLAVAEHRRYHQYEAKFGGRYLPFRFGAGIVEGLWSPLDAASKEKYGRPGVEQLERQKGLPILTKKLMGTDE